MNNLKYDYLKVVKLYLEKLKSLNKINDNSTLICYGYNEYIVALTKVIKEYSLKLILVVSDNVSVPFNDIELLRIPSFLGKDEEKLMASDMELELKDSFLIDFINNKEISSIIFKNMNNDYPYSETIYVEFLSASELNGFAKLYKLKYDSKVIGIKLLDSDLSNIDYDLVDEIVDKNDVIKLENSLIINM